MNNRFIVQDWNVYTKSSYLLDVIEGEKLGIVFVLHSANSNYEAIHPITKQLYQDLINKDINSVFEVGCAGGHNLYNIKKSGLYKDFGIVKETVNYYTILLKRND